MTIDRGLCEAFLGGALLVLGMMLADQPAQGETLWTYIGTYTRTQSKGIYLVKLDLATGRASEPELAAEAASPSFLALHPSRPLCYAVSEMGGAPGKKAGGVSAFAIEPGTGRLTLLNQQSSGAAPCHVALDPSSRCVVAASFGGGSVACLPIRPDGSLGEVSSLIQHEGSGANPKRQQGPHAHSTNFAPDGRFAFVADLGLDKVMIYRLDAAKGLLTPNDPSFVKLPDGSGPRHFAFHPNGQWAYVINEIDSTLSAMSYDAQRGAFSVLQTVGTLPPGFEGNNTTAEVQVHPSGRFVYGSNRGHDSIACFAVDPQKGTLSLLAHTPTQGKNPRNFGIDPSGAFLLAANQDGGNVVLFRIDANSGALQPTGQQLQIPMPVCVKFRRPL